MKTNLLPPAMIFYTDRLPEGVGGCANGPVIRIRPKYRDDVGIHQHELEHVKQFWFSAGLNGPLYLFSRRFRLWAEVAAYRVQMRFPPPLSVEAAAARLMSPRYDLGLTTEQAILELTK